jgi:hypothetical protein
MGSFRSADAMAGRGAPFLGALLEWLGTAAKGTTPNAGHATGLPFHSIYQLSNNRVEFRGQQSTLSSRAGLPVRVTRVGLV